ncbi:MAG: alginate O-acetyltransferase [Pseudomonas sp.]|nr:alginate O-acetyltransferase [Pseudomonas sp.]
MTIQSPRPAIRQGIRHSALAAALLSGVSCGVQAAQQPAAPQYQINGARPLCPIAADNSRYDTKYLEFFTHLVQAQGDWLFRSTYDLRTDFGTTAEGYQQLKLLRDGLKRKGIELMVVYQPTRGLINRSKLSAAERDSFDFELAKKNYLTTIAQLRKTGIWVPDFSPLFDEHQQHAYYFKGDHHWTPYGAERTAKISAATLKQIPGFSDIPKQEFASKRVGLLSKLGTFHKTAMQLCGNSYAPEYVDRFETEAVGESGGDGDLFGDESLPQVTLVGTSNSGPAYNFAGFLQQYSGAAVLNNALSGGGFDSSLLQYLGSPEFAKHPPKVIVWEFATHYDMAQTSFYRQAMPLLDNGCEGRPAALQNSVKLHNGANEVLVNGKQQLLDLRGSQYQVDLTFSDPSVKQLNATLWYLNGRRENFKIEQSKAVDSGGRYVFQLRNDPDWAELNLLAMEIHSPEEMPANLSVKATLCKRPSTAANHLRAKAEGGTNL